MHRCVCSTLGGARLRRIIDPDVYRERCALRSLDAPAAHSHSGRERAPDTALRRQAFFELSLCSAMPAFATYRCVFHAMPVTHSTRSRSLIPGDPGQFLSRGTATQDNPLPSLLLLRKRG